MVFYNSLTFTSVSYQRQGLEKTVLLTHLQIHYVRCYVTTILKTKLISNARSKYTNDVLIDAQLNDYRLSDNVYIDY